jgi:hypothetical protein
MVKELIAKLAARIASGEIIGPHEWCDEAAKIVVLLGAENEKLFALQRRVARHKSSLVEAGANVSSARAMVESTDDYWEAKAQEALVDQALELVMIAKKQATVARGTWNG